MPIHEVRKLRRREWVMLTLRTPHKRLEGFRDAETWFEESPEGVLDTPRVDNET